MLAGAALALGAWSAASQVQRPNRPVHPDETARQTYDERLSLQNSLSSTKQIGRALGSFAKLTKLARPKLTDAQIRQVGNTDPETQAMGFTNWVGAVEGTLRKQNYEIAKLQLQVAQLQYRSGKLSRAVVQKRQGACAKAQKDFQRFWDAFGIAD